jgi:hypothetical protein
MHASYGYDGDLPQKYKFTGKERESESGLDYFGARYNASTMGPVYDARSAAEQRTTVEPEDLEPLRICSKQSVVDCRSNRSL